ncbi:hypothetical protein NPIL_353321 [Nephila pilipes]|uniref:BTB domain-containing protein n=1 Tax=Nephila pilipes TaxID=299642 RepID=A0A8X6PKP9_NEPPI|nr:hypothetical protein NPIL_353321 [Nephila pilipes]
MSLFADRHMNNLIYISDVDDLDECYGGEIENLVMEGESPDVKLKTDNVVISCHKTIVCTRSPVICELLGFLDDDGKDVAAIEVDGKTLKQMVDFMYDKQIEIKTYVAALNLLAAGHKYLNLDLKEKISEYLKTVIDLKNIYEIIVAAETYEDENLMRCTLQYISDCREEITNKKSGRTFA